MIETAPEQSTIPSCGRDLLPLLQFALRGLEPMQDPEGFGFCHRVSKVAGGLHREGPSFRYSAITLMGLNEARRIGLTFPFDADAMFNKMMAAGPELSNAGDLALLWWLCARMQPGRLREVVNLKQIEKLQAAAPHEDSKTMESAWLLAALSYIRMAQPGEFPDHADLARSLFQKLKKNQGRHGIFGHQGASATPAGALRGALGSFADQVYPIYALARYAQAWGVEEALQSARQCADMICALQGPMGQWWWHYDARSGRAVGRYPVYSVHQDGMAPMALFAMSQASGANYDAPIYKGLAWIYGRNELQHDMRDSDTGLIWRSFYQNRFTKYSSEAMGILGMDTRRRARLHVLHECRPYHLGWLLYAFCSKLTRDGQL